MLFYANHLLSDALIWCSRALYSLPSLSRLECYSAQRYSDRYLTLLSFHKFDDPFRLYDSDVRQNTIYRMSCNEIKPIDVWIIMFFNSPLIPMIPIESDCRSFDCFLFVDLKNIWIRKLFGGKHWSNSFGERFHQSVNRAQHWGTKLKTKTHFKPFESSERDRDWETNRENEFINNCMEWLSYWTASDVLCSPECHPMVSIGLRRPPTVFDVLYRRNV